MDHAGRLGRVRERLELLDIDGLLVTSLTNVRYLTGFSGTNAQVLVSRGGAFFFTDGRYAARAGTLVKDADIGIYPNRLTEALQPRLVSLGAKRVGVEAGTMTLAERDDLDERLDAVQLVPTSGIVEDIRRVKDAAEIALMRQVVKLGDQAFEWVVGNLAPGRTEREVALDLEVWMRQHGADDVSFDPIVASGELSAHIHHTASDRAFVTGDLVLMDFGARRDGYCSDLTRTLVLGSATDEHHATYDLVLRAYRAGVDAVRAGAACAEVDATARSVIAEAGRAEEFGHGLGHGVGLDIHEAPRFSRISTEVLRGGEVMTVEPGVYRPGWGGIRIEDCVLVTEDGAEVLGSAPRDDLIEV